MQLVLGDLNHFHIAKMRAGENHTKCWDIKAFGNPEAAVSLEHLEVENVGNWTSSGFLVCCSMMSLAAHHTV